MRFTSVLAVAAAMALVVSSLSGSVGGRRMTEELWKAARRDQAEVDARGVDQGFTRADSDRTSADDRITSLPGLSVPFPSPQYAGYIEVDPSSGGKLFYWHAVSEHNPASSPLLIWLNGGPGCSSMSGMFSERTGPFIIDADDRSTLTLNPNNWNQFANMIWLDQPVGTGFSVANGVYADNQAEVTAYFMAFLRGFLARFPNLSGSNLFLMGESYAGTYIPWFAEAVANDPTLDLTMKGIGIGNGWTDPATQYMTYPDFAYGLGVIDEKQFYGLQSDVLACATHAANNPHVRSSSCSRIYSKIDSSTGPSVSSANPYDMRMYLNGHYLSSYPAPLVEQKSYLNKVAVKTAIHAEGSWADCSNPVFSHLAGDDMLGAIEPVARLLDTTDVRVFFFNGQFDFICNHVGNTRFLEALSWAGAADFAQAERKVWSVNGNTAGYWKATKDSRLTFALVLGAGHMVPFDQPERAAAMAKSFVSTGVLTNSQDQDVATNADSMFCDGLMTPSALVGAACTATPAACDASGDSHAGETVIDTIIRNGASGLGVFAAFVGGMATTCCCFCGAFAVSRRRKNRYARLPVMEGGGRARGIEFSIGDSTSDDDEAVNLSSMS